MLLGYTPIKKIFEASQYQSAYLCFDIFEHFLFISKRYS